MPAPGLPMPPVLSAAAIGRVPVPIAPSIASSGR
jgi:hypothetical protein